MKNYLKPLIILSIYCFLLVIFRITVTKSIFYGFLLWNLFLAYIPFIITHFWFPKIKHVLLKIGAVLLWLFFLPNAPYIITDLFHIHKGTTMPLWFDLLLVSSFAINGLLLYFLSILKMFAAFKSTFPKYLEKIVFFGIHFLVAFGIYLGRYLRWNSWDLINNPIAVVKDITAPFIKPFAHSQTWGITFGYGILFLICFSIVDQSKYSEKNTSFKK